MVGYEDSDQPAAAYSAAVAGWLHQVYHAQMMHYGNIYLQQWLSPLTSPILSSGFHSFLAYQAINGRFPSQQQQQSEQAAPVRPQQQQQNINLNLNIPGVGNLNLPGVGLNLNLNNNNGGAVPLLRATFVEVR